MLAATAASWVLALGLAPFSSLSAFACAFACAPPSCLGGGVLVLGGSSCPRCERPCFFLFLFRSFACWQWWDRCRRCTTVATALWVLSLALGCSACARPVGLERRCRCSPVVVGGRAFEIDPRSTTMSDGSRRALTRYRTHRGWRLLPPYVPTCTCQCQLASWSNRVPTRP